MADAAGSTPDAVSEKQGREFFRGGGGHTVHVNRGASDFLARKICRDLQVTEPAGKK
ncbi:MAG TPA: hypothetical protein VF668_07125 [Pyrinomonadaceae bacterium]|jgi:hypothetical protein